MNKRWLTRFLIVLIVSIGGRVLRHYNHNNSSIDDLISNQPSAETTAPLITPPTAPPTSQPLTGGNFNHPPTEVIEQEIHKQINAYRQSLGLTPLKEDYRITAESRKFSAKMASGAAKFSHDGFEQRAKNLEMKALKYISVGENLALLQGYEDLATTAVQGWIESPGHHATMIGDYDLTGIGVMKNDEGVYYFTQLFLKRQ